MEVFCVDLLLGMDNALLIALVCRSLRPEHRTEALVFGAAGAVLFRTLLATGVGSILRLPLLHFAGGTMLLLIALAINPSATASARPPTTSRNNLDEETKVRDLGAGIGLVILADAVMSLDNVLAVGAITKGHTAFTLLGLGASVPLVMFGGLVLSHLLERARALTLVGAVVVGWIAGELVVTDPLIASWATSQAPAWSLVIPGLCALFVAVDARWATRDARVRSGGKCGRV
ncbi:MAG: YjbE family putative metal transport protein [Betaproteobacteria bacterium]|nr:YjbE family putative metal transport protein [Betaproteobacteria bacterium]